MKHIVQALWMGLIALALSYVLYLVMGWEKANNEWILTYVAFVVGIYIGLWIRRKMKAKGSNPPANPNA